MVTAYLALGANLGDRRSNLSGAREALDRIPGLRVIAGSHLYETEPVGGPAGQKPYLNAVLKIETDLAAQHLLQVCHEVEHRFGRRRLVRWGPRTLDVDLLFYGEQVVRKKELTIPHPRLHERAFVLAPLRELAPELVHPILGRTISELFRGLSTTAGIARLCERL